MASKRFTPYASSPNAAPIRKRRNAVRETTIQSTGIPTQENGKPSKLPYRQLDALMLNTTFPLNNSYSKEAVVGISADSTFRPVLHLLRTTSTGRHGICLSVDDWNELMDSEASISAYFAHVDNAPVRVNPINIGGFIATFQSIYGKQTLVLTKKTSDTADFAPDSIALQRLTWDGLRSTRKCISLAFSEASSTSRKVVASYELLNNYVYEHLSSEVTNDTKSNDEVLSNLVSEYFRDLDCNRVKALKDHFVCYSLGLHCVNLFVNSFKMQSFYNDFSTETQAF